MENIKKFDIKSFLIGVFLMVFVMQLGFYYYKNNIILKNYISIDEYNTKITEVAAYVPEIVYLGNGNSVVYFNDWFNKYDNYYKQSYFRVMNKDYLVTDGGIHGYLENQLEITLFNYLDKKKNAKFFNKYTFEQELKKYTDKRFTILTTGTNYYDNWVIDFDTKVTKEEMEKIKLGILSNLDYVDNSNKLPLVVKYNSILVPKSFNDKGFGKEIGENQINY